MPRKPGVSNDLRTAPISNSGTAAAPGLRPDPASPLAAAASSSLRLSQRTGPIVEQVFDQGKHVFDRSHRLRAEPDSKERIKSVRWGIVVVSPHCALGGGGAMALSMEEQRILAEIERQLAGEDPGLAVRLSRFGRPGLAAGLNTPRGRVLASFFVVGVVALLSLMVYSLMPLRVAPDG